MISAPISCPHFIGRRRELAFLIERRRDLVKSHGGIVLVAGDAGVGKSRLVREFLDVTGAARGRVAVARCRPFGAVAYRPLTTLLETLAPATARLAPAATHGEQLRGLADALLDAARKNAIVAIVEDLHWCDAGTLEVLDLIADRLRTQRILIVGTYRANELGPLHPHFVPFGALLRSAGVATVELAPLPPPDIRAFVDATLRAARRDVPLDVRRRVVRIAEGNPFFTEELLKSAVDGRLTGRDRHPLPTTIHAAIAERLRELDDADRAVLSHAAVIGRTFDYELLTRATGAGEGNVLDALRRARALQIVEETGDARTFRFRHALTRETTYAELLATERQTLHRRIASTLEADAGGNRTPQALAHHWWAAGDRAKTLTYGERSGDDAQRLHSYSDAIASYEATLDALDADGPDGARLSAKLALAYLRSGILDRAIAHGRRAWSGVRETNADAATLFALARTLSAALYNDGHPRLATEFTGEARAAIASRGDPIATERVNLAYAALLVDSGDVDAARTVLVATNRELVASDGELDLVYWGAVSSLAGLEGDVETLRSAAARLGDATTRASGAALIDALAETGYAALLIGEMPMARRMLDAAIAAASPLVNATLHGDLLLTRAFERTWSGAYVEARDLIARALPMLGDVPAAWYGAKGVALMVGWALEDDALLDHEPGDELLDGAFETGKPHVFGPLVASYAEILTARREHAVALKLLRRALAAARDAMPRFGSFPLVVVAARLCEEGDADAIRDLCDAYGRIGHAATYSAELADAVLLSRFGHRTASVEPARRAAKGFADIAWPAFEALALEIAGDRTGAERIFDGIGYRTTARRRQTPRLAGATPAELTPREFEIARLVGAGGSNRHVAATLGVSVKLVEKHLSSTYAKLGLTSRSQLAAHLAARPASPSDGS